MDIHIYSVQVQGTHTQLTSTAYVILSQIYIRSDTMKTRNRKRNCFCLHCPTTQYNAQQIFIGGENVELYQRDKTRVVLICQTIPMILM